LVQTRPQSF